MSTLPNPYALSPDKVEEPPTHFLGMLRHMGPGFILSASIVGSGELIATTILGAQAGFVTFWVILVSCLVKVTLQLEFGKHAVQSGEPTFQSFNQLPGPKWGKASWSTWTWFVIMAVKFLQVGGIVGGVAIILDMVVPLPLPELWGESVSWGGRAFGLPGESLTVWALLTAVSVSLLVFRGYYGVIEKVCLVMIAAFTVLTLASVVALQFTDFAIGAKDILSGLTFHLPAETVILIAAIGAFGITGVGGDEIMTYNYWLLEKGYAAKTGKRDDSEAWVRRARGWIKVMYWDAILSMIVYTVVTAAFYILGAAVLHKQGLVPESKELVRTLSRMYTDTLGPWANGVFLGGAVVVLASTLFAALGGWTRLYTDCFARIGLIDFENVAQRRRTIAVLAWVIPLVWAVLFLFVQLPGIMVLLGGVGTSLILLIVVFAAFHFRYRRLPESLRPGRFYDVALWASALVIVGSGIYGAVMIILNFMK